MKTGDNGTELPLDDETLEEWLSELDSKRERIHAQSKTVASYIESNEEFYDWFSGVEGFHLREERFWDDCARADSEQLFQWVRWAFHLGWIAGRNHRD